jgi:hypothetical protein
VFSLFGSPSVVDAVLGDLRRRGGAWRGTIDLARTLPSAYPAWRARIAAALFEHYEALAQGDGGGDLDGASDGRPRIGRPDEVWPHARIAFVAVIELEGEPGVEIGYEVAWDDDHTLGARLRDGRLVELNGSVLPP